MDLPVKVEKANWNLDTLSLLLLLLMLQCSVLLMSVFGLCVLVEGLEWSSCTFCE